MRSIRSPRPMDWKRSRAVCSFRSSCLAISRVWAASSTWFCTCWVVSWATDMDMLELVMKEELRVYPLIVNDLEILEKKVERMGSAADFGFEGSGTLCHEEAFAQ